VKTTEREDQPLPTGHMTMALRGLSLVGIQGGPAQPVPKQSSQGASARVGRHAAISRHRFDAETSMSMRAGVPAWRTTINPVVHAYDCR
jgi:hypothetical protein